MCSNHELTGREPGKGEGASALATRRRLIQGLWTGTVLLAVPGCAALDETFAPPESQLLQLSAQAWAETKQQTPISRDPAANRRLQQVGQRIAAVSGATDAQWEFVVFESEEKNAWVLPGGKVGFYKGLMDFVDNDDQVAAVLGHEVGHVTRRHAALRAGRMTTAGLVQQLGGAILSSQVNLSNEQLNLAMAAAGAGLQIGVVLPFSRENEMEADRVGVDYMHAAGYDVRAAIRLWEKMGAASGARQPQWLSTHPNPETRIQDLRSYINNHGYAVV